MKIFFISVLSLLISVVETEILSMLHNFRFLLQIKKNMILKVYNLITGVNETKHLAHLVSCDSKCGLNESVCNSKQKWNHDKCWCDCKELRACDSCIDDYIWNPTMSSRE